MSIEHSQPIEVQPVLTTRDHWTYDTSIRYGRDDNSDGDTLQFESSHIPNADEHLAPQVIAAIRFAMQNKAALFCVPEDEVGSLIDLRRSDYYNDLSSNADLSHKGLQIMHDPNVQLFLDRRRNQVEEATRDIKLNAWELAQDFADGVEVGIEEGYIPEYVRERIPDLFKYSRILVQDDAFLNRHQGYYGSNTGLYDSVADKITVSHSLPRGVMDVTIYHELDHKLQGGTFSIDSSGDVMRDRVGAFNTIRKSHILNPHSREATLNNHGIAFTEAITEHRAQSTKYGELDILDPDEREHKGGSYYVERKLLAAIIKKSNGLIDLKTVVRAMYEDTGPSGSTEERRKMVAQFVDAYGFGSRREFQYLVDKINDLAFIHSSSYVKRAIAYTIEGIVSPVVGEDGEIIQPGYFSAA